MNSQSKNRFETFFADGAYVGLKNELYNYRLRKRAVRRSLNVIKQEQILEVGSGLSPMITDFDRVVYTDLSFSALKILKKAQPKGLFVVADVTNLPFKANGFSAVVCSEVLEHLHDDCMALQQIAEVMKPGGSLLLTFPHRRCYFSIDDRFVNHFRRYDISEMETLLRAAGLRTLNIRKVLGPMEKLIMVTVVAAMVFRNRLGRQGPCSASSMNLTAMITPVFAAFNRLLCLPVWLDARLAPRALASVLLFSVEKPTPHH